MNKIRCALHLMAVCAIALSLSVPAHAQWGNGSPVVTYNMSNDEASVDTSGGGNAYTPTHSDPPTMHVTGTVYGGPSSISIYSSIIVRRDYFYHFAYTGSTPTPLHYTENDKCQGVVSGIYGSGTINGFSPLCDDEKETTNFDDEPSHATTVQHPASTYFTEVELTGTVIGRCSPPPVNLVHITAR